MMKGDIRCVEGRSYRHDPQHDDPDLETDIGRCPECEGKGCNAECDCCGGSFPREEMAHCVAFGIETFACDQCRGGGGR